MERGPLMDLLSEVIAWNDYHGEEQNKFIHI